MIETLRRNNMSSERIRGDGQYAVAARLLDAADGLLITAGAGMGVDSGLPDFRGAQGFWQAYPALAKSRIHFQDIASPETFESDPALAWGFYGHRLALYRRTIPHEGYCILLKWSQQMPKGVFVFTSNVDGQFQKAGFADNRVCECHGSIHHLQCTQPCLASIWPASEVMPEVDEDQCRLVSPLPVCRDCGELARPNILMFGDWSWQDHRTQAQQLRLNAWLAGVSRPVVIELGAGTNIPTVRRFGEALDAPLIRINPTEPAVVHRRDVSLAMGALETLREIDAALAGG
mgnify:CR=1 FL=1